MPADQADIYALQSQWLDAYRRTVAEHAASHRSNPVFGGHLLTADSNRADALLQPDALKWVNLSLDRFQEMGINGVTLNIGYPVLMPEAPNADRYLQYYRDVAKEVHRRGMTLAVEQIVLYAGSQFTPFSFKFGGLTLAKYTDDQARMAQIIIDNLAPDYLTVLHEPDTVAELTGLHEMLQPAVATAYVNNVLGKLRRGRTLIGAGSGSWSDPAFAESFSQNTSIDYVDAHIYWIDPASVDRLYAMARSASAHGKPLIVTEAGLYKSMGRGIEGTSHVDGVAAVYRRDVFSFWAPLDAGFIKTTGDFARTVDTKYLSIYWTNMFFSYVDWNAATAQMSYAQLNRQLSAQLTAEAWTADRFTCAASAYKAVIDGGAMHLP